MNCLNADPTEAKQLPLVEQAARAGCEYFVIDAGWYADIGRSWWDTVGEWEVNPDRYPHGLETITQAIRAQGMIPGLWLEIEVMGIHCPLAGELPDEWFFLSKGRRVIDHGRYQLDFRNPEVRAHADRILDRFIIGHGFGYIKMDYNINAGPGTDCRADSPGEGLLGHNRAYLAWVEALQDRHPGLVVENCGSGGLRMDSAMQRVHSIQSVTDQSDVHFNALIAASAASAVPPEQAAIWSYPLPNAREEDVTFNMVNALLLRVHLSGDIMAQGSRSFRRIQEAISLYKQIRRDLPASLPRWPLGLPRPGHGWIAYGSETPRTLRLALWRLDDKSALCKLPLPQFKGQHLDIRCLYPSGKQTLFSWDRKRGELSVTLKQKFAARLLEIMKKQTTPPRS
jgi:alpha-galactosidase